MRHLLKMENSPHFAKPFRGLYHNSIQNHDSVKQWRHCLSKKHQKDRLLLTKDQFRPFLEQTSPFGIFWASYSRCQCAPFLGALSGDHHVIVSRCTADGNVLYAEFWSIFRPRIGDFARNVGNNKYQLPLSLFNLVMALMVEVMPSEKNQMGFAAIDLSFVSCILDFLSC